MALAEDCAFRYVVILYYYMLEVLFCSSTWVYILYTDDYMYYSPKCSWLYTFKIIATLTEAGFMVHKYSGHVEYPEYLWKT
jgi:hypothetical protein